MPRLPDREQQVIRFYRRRKRVRVLSGILEVILRLLGILLTAVCTYWVFFDDDALRIQGFAAAVLFVLLYVQCVSFSGLGLRLFAKGEERRRGRLAAASVLICAPLYFVVLVVSIIPLTERAAFFVTVLPTMLLNAMPMEAVRDEYSLRSFPVSLFWGIQLTVQFVVFAVGQLYGQYLLLVWG